MTPDLSARAVDARELMDDPDCDLRMLERTYEQFPLVNTMVSRWHSVYRRDIRPRARRKPLRLLDVGAGGGDVSRALAAWARRDGLQVAVTALDADDRAIRWARERGGGVSYRCAHTSSLVAAGERFDAVVSNHLLHHLTGSELLELLDDSIRLVEDDGLVLHRDIARSRFAYRAFAAGTRPFARNVLAESFIREDGLTSIRRSYTAHEIAEIVPAGWQVRQELPSRLELRWEAWDARP
ncbi:MULTISPECIES: methyltransferase domain-containing protein [unclassified Microbacterium]|uniref:methyltransferase domain-containing protein n=1 Tax=unclassified Microbacterium TaxID=2609290 RepID=UPI002C060D26|nr:methyltransferase domain-containing protein [Microbacterium sp.]HWK77934.1 methyltransferase domain-containing protein [Microbacterium sp.]